MLRELIPQDMIKKTGQDEWKRLIVAEFNGTMQNRFLNLDNFFIYLAYGDLMVGISDGTNCF